MYYYTKKHNTTLYRLQLLSNCVNTKKKNVQDLVNIAQDDGKNNGRVNIFTPNVSPDAISEVTARL